MKIQKPVKNQQVVLILDRSGSMGSIVNDVIGGVNSMLADLRKDQKVKSFVSIYLFDHELLEYCLDVEASKVQDLTRETFVPRGMTALVDSVHTVINSMEWKKNYLAPIVITYTDGCENASKEFKSDQLSALISGRTELGWVFTYLGANQDAWGVAAAYGFDRGSTVTFNAENNFGTMTYVSSKISDYRIGLVDNKTFLSGGVGSTALPEEELKKHYEQQ